MKSNSNHPDYSDVGLRIRRERTLWNMTQDELSQELGISANYLGQIERGSRGVSRKMEDRLCEMFHMTHDEFRQHKGLDPYWSANVAESGVIFHDLSENDLMRLLHGCSQEELQLCGHLIRCTLYYMRNTTPPQPVISRLDKGSGSGSSGSAAQSLPIPDISDLLGRLTPRDLPAEGADSSAGAAGPA